MVWTLPKTWIAEPLTAADMNTHIRDNLDALKDPPSGIYDAVEGTDLTLNSTTWADVHATDGKFQHTIVANGGDILIIVDASIGVNATLILYLDVAIDGTDYGVTTLTAADGLYATQIASSASAVDGHVNFIRYIPASAVPAGSHTIKLRYKVSANTATLYRAAGTGNADIAAQFVVREVS